MCNHPLELLLNYSDLLELSNEVLHVLVSQRAAELQAVKVCDQKNKAEILGSRLQFRDFM